MLLFSILFSNCDKKDTNEDIDNRIYSQIFQTIVDSCVVIKEPVPNPNLGHVVLKEYENRIKNAFERKMLIAIYDTIRAYDKTKFENEVAKSSLNLKWATSDITNLVIKCDDYQVKSNVKLVRAMSLPSLDKSYAENKSWENYDELENLDAAISLNRVLLDENKTKGFLQIGVICGKLCGQGFDIWIKKENNIWRIIDIKRTWIS